MARLHYGVFNKECHLSFGKARWAATQRRYPWSVRMNVGEPNRSLQEGSRER